MPQKKDTEDEYDERGVMVWDVRNLAQVQNSGGNLLKRSRSFSGIGNNIG